ncbi:MAG: 5-formyltetrahydrofolate cyclo-ligase [Elusimicrobiota bacterium]|nr:5-formyltetrahydrofolate cyclo-ligase [Elusimicrobiota bacterium]
MNDYLESEKRKIRYDFLALRNSVDPANALIKSAAIFAEIQKLSVYQKAQTVMFYLSYGSEVITDFMVNSALSDEKTVAVPSIEFPDVACMQAVRIFHIDDASQMVYGIRQPAIDQDYVITKDELDLVFVPGIAFDVQGYRTGYGKGFYDKWLSNVPTEKTIGLAYDFQIIEKLSVSAYDLPVGLIVSEERVIKTK